MNHAELTQVACMKMPTQVRDYMYTLYHDYLQSGGCAASKSCHCMYGGTKASSCDGDIVQELQGGTLSFVTPNVSLAGTLPTTTVTTSEFHVLYFYLP